MRAASNDPIVIDRSEGYLGVLIDDLVTKGVTEPYRMFTSRAEYRLMLRSENADQRLTPLGVRLGIVSNERAHIFQNKIDNLSLVRQLANSLTLSSNQASGLGFNVKQNGQTKTVFELLSYHNVEMKQIIEIWPEFKRFDPDICKLLIHEARYAVYVERQIKDVENMRKDLKFKIPENFDYTNISSLSNELRGKLQKIKPENLDQASRIDGMTPVGITLILAHIKLNETKKIA